MLVESYIREGQPVGSRTLAKAAGLELSPATIRNVMADLEDMGLIVSPHTSAGRVPTAQGYRFFVDTLLNVEPFAPGQIEEFKQSLNPDLGYEHLLESASRLLSGVSRLAGVVTVPRQEQSQLRQVEFLQLSGNRVLAILVMGEREVQNRILHLDRTFSESELRQAANFLTAQFAGKSLNDIRQSLLADMEDLRRDVDAIMRTAILLGGQALAPDGPDTSRLVMQGEVNLFEYQELSDLDKLKQLFAAFNEKREILHLLDRCIRAEGVQIFIGQESGFEFLDECSLVTAPYSVSGEIIGVLGVIGPTRMQYDRVIPLVDITARLLGAAMHS
ncbi:MAG: heat-inducible transcriptional repressor HrcA [Acidihalobacter sp.]